MEKGGEKDGNEKEADYSGFSEQQIDLDGEKGIAGKYSPKQTKKPSLYSRKTITVFQSTIVKSKKATK